MAPAASASSCSRHLLLAACLASAACASTGDGASDKLPERTASKRLRCGWLGATAARDRDALCVHLVHNASGVLSTLTLLNRTIEHTIATTLPSSLDAGSDAWWSLRDGVLWKATGGAKAHARIDPFSFTAWLKLRSLKTAS